MISCFGVFGQSKQIEKQNIQIMDSLYQYQIVLRKQIESTERLQKEKDSILEVLSIQHSKIDDIQNSQVRLHEENNVFKTTIDTNTNLFNGISTFFTIISILLTIIVIAIPLINYFLVLKPNEKIVKKVKNLETDVLKTMEGNFESYFEKLRRQKTLKILSLLDDRLKLSEVTGYFMLNDIDNLEEEDILKLIDFLKNNQDIEPTDAIILNSLVVHSGYLIAEKYYKSVFELELKNSEEYAIEYLVENDFESHIPYIEKILKANDKGHHLLIKFFDYIQDKYIGNWQDKKVSEKKEIGIKYAKLLFDNDKILKSIEDKEIPKTFGFEEHPININRLNDNKYLRETKYYEKYLKEMDDKHK